jgi:prepilin-type N-terminal cleavage/methylation domain-containing protein
MRKGFTLVETLVAITILTLSTGGPLFTASRAVVAAQVARDHLIASYLAQEGLEYMRAMRDNAYLEYASPTPSGSSAWNNFIGGGSANSVQACINTSCTLDQSRPLGVGNGLAVQPCSGSCSPLRLAAQTGDAASFVYTQQNSGTVTPFTRTLRVVDSGTYEASVTVTVSWTFHGIPYKVEMSDHLTAWQ